MNYKVIWTASAKNDLRKIVGNVSNKKFDEIYKSPLSITFSEQFQIDDYRLDCRRMIVGNYKLLYQFQDNSIFIIRVFNTLQNPSNSLK
jgi:mRNA-degrading endonuclease RelE of RelBE toxin-antitoxin system